MSPTRKKSTIFNPLSLDEKTLSRTSIGVIILSHGPGPTSRLNKWLSRSVLTRRTRNWARLQSSKPSDLPWKYVSNASLPLKKSMGNGYHVRGHEIGRRIQAHDTLVTNHDDSSRGRGH